MPAPQAAQLNAAMVPLGGLPPRPPAWRRLSGAAAAAGSRNGSAAAAAVVAEALAWRRHLVPDVEGASGGYIYSYITQSSSSIQCAVRRRSGRNVVASYMVLQKRSDSVPPAGQGAPPTHPLGTATHRDGQHCGTFISLLVRALPWAASLPTCETQCWAAALSARPKSPDSARAAPPFPQSCATASPHDTIMRLASRALL